MSTENSNPMPGFIELCRGEGPIVAVAIHDGHTVRDEVAAGLKITSDQRLREEDSYTAAWTMIAPTRVIGLRSRFEIDLNRLRHRSVYLTPKDAWGLDIWRTPPSDEIVERSLSLYDTFYESMFELFSGVERRYGTFFVYDFHAYNYRRGGPDAEPAAPIDNPQINVCTGGMDLERCEPVVACLIRNLRDHDFPGGPLDVRRNVRFRATRFSRWVHENFPGTGISIGIEVKKFFMDERTGELDVKVHQAIGDAFASTVKPISDLLKNMEVARNLT